MLKIINSLIKPLLVFAFVYLAIIQLRVVTVWVMDSYIPFQKSLCFGVLGGLAVGFLVRPGLAFTFVHEITHWIAALFRGVKPRAFYVEDTGRGYIQLRKVTAVIALAPYFLNVLCLASLAMFKYHQYLNVSKSTGIYGYIAFFIGFSFSLHVVYTLRTIRRQSDLKQGGGVLFSYSLILCLFILSSTIIFSLYTSNSAMEGVHLFWHQINECAIQIKGDALTFKKILADENYFIFNQLIPNISYGGR